MLNVCKFGRSAIALTASSEVCKFRCRIGKGHKGANCHFPNDQGQKFRGRKTGKGKGTGKWKGKDGGGRGTGKGKGKSNGEGNGKGKAKGKCYSKGKSKGMFGRKKMEYSGVLGYPIPVYSSDGSGSSGKSMLGCNPKSKQLCRDYVNGQCDHAQRNFKHPPDCTGRFRHLKSDTSIAVLAHVSTVQVPSGKENLKTQGPKCSSGEGTSQQRESGQQGKKIHCNVCACWPVRFGIAIMYVATSIASDAGVCPSHKNHDDVHGKRARNWMNSIEDVVNGVRYLDVLMLQWFCNYGS